MTAPRELAEAVARLEAAYADSPDYMIATVERADLRLVLAALVPWRSHRLNALGNSVLPLVGGHAERTLALELAND